jgi:hypothetical protein
MFLNYTSSKNIYFEEKLASIFKGHKSAVEAVRVLVYPVREPLEALRLLQRRESVCRGRVSVVEAMKVSVEAVKAVRVPIVIVGEPKEAARV